MNDWISCSKQMPKLVRGQEFVPILFALTKKYVEKNMTRRICAGRYFPKGYGRPEWKFVSLQGGVFAKSNVGHWMPMPDDP